MATDPVPSAPRRAAPRRAALDRCCDLVLKGGLTSGILYPPAICRIAERFHLVGVGGTSAGAIAGCLAAAAEYRRRTTGGDDGRRSRTFWPGLPSSTPPTDPSPGRRTRRSRTARACRSRSSAGRRCEALM
jgi:predicted acylesterase/phospholipase RssA